MNKEQVKDFLANQKCFKVELFSFKTYVFEYVEKETRISAQLGEIFISFQFDENGNLIEMLLERKTMKFQKQVAKKNFPFSYLGSEVKHDDFHVLWLDWLPTYPAFVYIATLGCQAPLFKDGVLSDTAKRLAQKFDISEEDLTAIGKDFFREAREQHSNFVASNQF